jgi:hypothetical protein
MRLPRIDASKDYSGLYVVDFGDQAGIGYTIEEVRMLMEEERYRKCRVYKVHGMRPDGTVELKAVSPTRFAVESAYAFCSRKCEQARADFDSLRQLAETDPLPCKARLLFGKLSYGPQFPYVAAIIYPAEYEDELSQWLLRHDVQAGETVDHGISHAQNIQANLQVRDHAQLPAQAWRQSRSRDELLRAVGDGVQR